MYSYKTLESKVEDILFKEKSSKFIGYAYSVSCVEEVKPIVDELKKKHPSASHICFAYRIGISGEIYRANDDGEPSGTAGNPILNRMIAHEITNSVVFIVRYFGGTKLGVSGLISAYKDSAEMTIQKGKIIEKELTEKYSIQSDFEHMSKLINLFENNNCTILETHYMENITYTVEIPIQKLDEISQKINAIHYEIAFKKVE
ncbi:MAG: YigZ family protein [Flavobacteriales bacterium]|nr:YigZ family protein [Flavobacteriales bacterium]